RRVCHRLLIVRAEGWQFRTMAVERFAQPGDIAVAEDRPHTCEERHFTPLEEGALRGEVADERLRHREPDLAHQGALPAALKPPFAARAACHASINASRFFRVAATNPASSISFASHARAGSPKIVRPTANPRQVLPRAASAKPRAKSSIGAFKPRTTTPRQYGSRSAMSASSNVQPSRDGGGSFHHSG